MPLTMENSGAALVAGTPLPRKTRLVRVVRPFMLDGGNPAAAGEEIELPATFAAEMVGAGKAEFIVAEPAPAAPAAAPTKTTKGAAHARK